jgi:hypothetical protein
MVGDGKLDEDRAELIWRHAIFPTLEEYFYNRPDILKRYDFDELKSQVRATE